jgi:2-hydroxychromene-2-carboxylate isomerase
MPHTFALTYDYRCPYARIANDHVLTALAGGGDLDVTFVPFSLTQAHLEMGETTVWEAPAQDSGIEALQASVAIRDHQPEFFIDAHRALYEFRHAEAGNLRDRDALTRVLNDVGVDTEAMWHLVDQGTALAVIESEHTRYANSHEVWGVPTFISGDAAVFVRLLAPALGDAELAVRTVNRILEQMQWSLLNEFKHTTVPH